MDDTGHAVAHPYEGIYRRAPPKSISIAQPHACLPYTAHRLKEVVHMDNRQNENNK